MLRDGIDNKGSGDKAHAGVKPSRDRIDSRATPVPRREANQNTCRAQHFVSKGKAGPREIAKTPKASPRALKQLEAAGREAQGAEAHGWSAWHESKAGSPGSRHKAGGTARTDQVTDGQEGQGTNRRLYADRPQQVYMSPAKISYAQCHNTTRQGFRLLVYGSQVWKLQCSHRQGSYRCIKSRAMSHRVCTKNSNCLVQGDKPASARTAAGLEAEAVCTHEEAQKPESARNGHVASPALSFVLLLVMP